MSEIAIEVQGDLVALAGSWARPPEGKRRGNVTRFSDASRKRLMRLTARLEKQSACFLTLTYPRRFPPPMIAKEHRRAFLMRLYRRYPKCSALWRIEPQKRGAPHFHLILFNFPYTPWEDIQRWWTEICDYYVDDHDAGINIKWLWNPRQVMAYVSKYIAKLPYQDPWDPASGVLGNSTYLHVGRWWGVHNRACLPWAVRHFLTFPDTTLVEFERAKQRLAQEWEGVNQSVGFGCVVFSDNAYLVFAEVVRELLHHAQ